MSFKRPGVLMLAAGLVLVVVVGACGDGSAADETPASATQGPNALSSRTELGESGSLFQPPAAAPGFTLTSMDGEPVSLSDFRGEVVALYFGYTHCPDMCPLTLGTYKSALGRLPEDVAAEVQVILVSVDPERDTPEVLERYMPLFDEDFIGVTGTLEEIDQVLAAWGIEIARGTPDENGQYEVEHPAGSWIVDQQGRLRLEVSHMTGSDALAADLQTIVEEGTE